MFQRARTYGLMKSALRAFRWNELFASNDWQVTHTRFDESNALSIRIAFLSLRAVPAEAEQYATRSATRPRRQRRVMTLRFRAEGFPSETEVSL